MIEVENFVRLFERAAKAMKDAAQFSGVRLHDFESVVPRVALMNHDIKAQLSGEIELLLKKTGLPRFIGAVLYVCFDLLFDLTLQRASENLHVLLFCSLDTRQMMIIQTCLANRDHARAVRQLAQRRHDVVLGFFETGLYYHHLPSVQAAK